MDWMNDVAAMAPAMVKSANSNSSVCAPAFVFLRVGEGVVTICSLEPVRGLISFYLLRRKHVGRDKMNALNAIFRVYLL